MSLIHFSKFSKVFKRHVLYLVLLVKWQSAVGTYFLVRVIELVAHFENFSWVLFVILNLLIYQKVVVVFTSISLELSILGSSMSFNELHRFFY